MIRHILLLTTVSLPCLAGAQTGKDTIKTDIYVDDYYTPTLADGVKIPVVPKPQEVRLNSPVLKYELPVPVNNLRPPIYAGKALDPGATKISKLYPGYVKVGFGNYLSPLVEASYNNTRSRKFNYGAEIRHFSGNPKDWRDFSDNSAKAHFTRFFQDNRKLWTKAAYERNRVSLATDAPLVHQTAGLEVGYENLPADLNSYKHSLQASYFYNQNDFGGREHDVQVKGLFSGLIRGKLFQLAPSFDYVLNEVPSLTQNRVIVKIQPKYIIRTARTTADIGFNAVVDHNEEKGLLTVEKAVTKFRFFPVVNAAYQFIPRKLSGYGQINGDVHKLTQAAMIRQNPWLIHSQQLGNSTFLFSNPVDRMAVRLGIKGVIRGKNSFDLSTGYRNTLNLPVMIAKTGIYRTYGIQSDEAYVVLDVRASYTYQFSETVRLYLQGMVNHYEMKDQTEAYNLPLLELKVGGNYNFGNKFYFSGHLGYIGTRMNRTVDLSTGNIETIAENELPGFVDISLNAEYRYTKFLSAFVTCSNLASRQYQWFQYYPSYGIQVLGGLTYRF